MRAISISLIVIAVAAACAAATDISGSWTGNIEIRLPDGSTVIQPGWAEFHQNGQLITGTAGGGDSEESLPIEKGVFDGKTVLFQFTGMDGRVYKANLSLTGEDCVDGTLDFALPDGTPLTARMVLKRGKTNQKNGGV